MKSNKILNGLDYLSIMFAPFIFPLIVWFVTEKGSENHHHAGRALKLHLIPVVFSIIAFIVIGGFGAVTKSTTAVGGAAIPVLVIAAIVDVVLGVYSIYYGIKVMIAAD